MIPAVNQIEFNPYLVDNDILDVCKEHGIIVQAYAPLGSGANNPAFLAMCKQHGLPDGGKLNNLKYD